MPFNEDFKLEEARRLEEGKKSREHYKKVNLPGDRTFGVDVDSIREKVAELKKDSDLPLHDV